MTPDIAITYSLLDQKDPITVLAVDDDAVSLRFLEMQIKQKGHRVVSAQNGQEAIQILKQNPGIDIIFMDRNMPVMDGISAVKFIKDNPSLRKKPVIMVTSLDSQDEIKDGVDAGVFYYLTKPVKKDMFSSVLSAAVRDVRQNKVLAEELAKHKTSFNLIDTGKFTFHTLDEAKSLAAFLANCFPDPERVLPGLGEILVNAIEHGNLGIGYDKKTELVESGIWESEINRLQKLPENQHKSASATVAHKPDGTYVIVEDQGDGFAWKNYLRIDPARAGDNHGRGIAQANISSFDKLTFNPKGNKAVAFVGANKQLEW